MATVIDSLLITLGLDTSKFNDAQKKAVESLRKTDEQAKKTNDNLQRNTKQTTEGFEKAKDAMVSFGTFKRWRNCKLCKQITKYKHGTLQ